MKYERKEMKKKGGEIVLIGVRLKFVTLDPMTSLPSNIRPMHESPLCYIGRLLIYLNTV